MARFTCTTCGLAKDVPDKFLGRTAHCPRCRGAVTVAPEPPASDDPLFTPNDPFLKSLDVDVEPPPTPPLSEIKAEPPAAAIVLDEPLRRPILPPRETFFGDRPLVDVAAGLLAGAISALFCLAFASLAFGGSLPPGEFVYGLNATLLGGAILAGVVAWSGGLPFAVAGPETTTVAVAALMSADVAARLAAAAPDLPVAPTVLACLAASGLVLGLSCLFIGVNALSQWLRYVPHQVLGGVMAGVGLAVVKLAFAFMERTAPCLAETALGRLVSGADCLRWLPGLALGLVLFAVLRKVRHFAVLPAAIVLLAVAVHVLAPAGLLPLSEPERIFYAAPPTGHLAAIYRSAFLAQIDWTVVLAQAPWFLVLAALSLAGTMFKVAEVETSLGRNLDLDRILKSVGLANLTCGLTQAMPGSISRGRSLSAMGAGGRGPLTGLTAGLVCLLALVLAPLFLPFVPRLLSAMLLVFIGVKLMVRWLVDTWSLYSRRDDYWLLVTVFVVTAVFGLPLGVGFAAVLGLMIQISRSGRLLAVKHALSGASHRSNVERSPAELAVLKRNGAAIHILRLQGFVFLGTVETLLAAVRERLEADDLPPLSFLVLDFRQVTGLDSAVAMGFAKLKSLAAEACFVLVLTSLPLEAERQLTESGIIADSEEERIRTFLDVDFALEWCENALLAAAAHKAAPGRNLAELLAPAFPDPALAARLMHWLVRQPVTKGQYVFRQGEPSEAMYFIESGTVNVELDLPGRSIRLKKMGPGTVFGEMGIYTDAPRSASILAAEDCVLYRLTKERLDILQRREPVLVAAVHRFIVGLLSARVAEANVRIGDLLK